MQLECKRQYTAKDTGTVYEQGKLYDIASHRAIQLVQTSNGALVPTAREEKRMIESMGLDMGEGLVAPDRQARGGRKRAPARAPRKRP